MNLSLNNTFSASATVSSSFSVDKAVLSGGLNFSLTKSHSVSYVGTYDVPNSNAGRQVKRVKLNAYPVLSMYSFDWYEPERYNLVLTRMVLVTGTAGKPIGVSYTKTFEYK